MNRPKKRRNANGIASTDFDRGCMRVRFPAAFSMKTWGKHKYLYLGLHHDGSSGNPKNLVFAEKLVDRINSDIANGCFDKEFDTYKEMICEFRSSHSRPSAKDLPTNFIDWVAGFFHELTLFEVYQKFKVYKQDFVAETTYLLRYQGRYRRIFDVNPPENSRRTPCPQDLKKPDEIKNHLLENYSPATAKTALAVLHEMVEWAKATDLLHPSIRNPYKQYSQKIPDVSQKLLPKAIQELEDEGQIDFRDLGICAFTSDEARAIMEAFEMFVARNNNNKTPWDLVVKFLFWTGCRHGKCAGLWWNDVSPDCSKIRFQFSYEGTTGIRKGLKTSGKGKKEKNKVRIFYCGPQLQELLSSIRPTGEFNRQTPVFCNRSGEPILFNTFQKIWSGSKEYQPGILPELMREGKVQYYLSPYSTRHTFINAMIEQGKTFCEVADLVGNSAVMIENHYRSRSRDPIVPVEI